MKPKQKAKLPTEAETLEMVANVCEKMAEVLRSVARGVLRWREVKPLATKRQRKRRR